MHSTDFNCPECCAVAGVDCIGRSSCPGRVSKEQFMRRRIDEFLDGMRRKFARSTAPAGYEFMACPLCANKGWTSVLCVSCLHNRAVITELNKGLWASFRRLFSRNRKMIAA